MLERDHCWRKIFDDGEEIPHKWLENLFLDNKICKYALSSPNEPLQLKSSFQLKS